MRLLKATIASVSEGGFSSVTFTEITRRAGVSIGAAQHHFQSKADLILATVGYVFTEMDLFVSEMSPTSGSVDERLDKIISVYWSWFSSPEYLAAWELVLGARRDAKLFRELSERVVVAAVEPVNDLWRAAFSDVEMGDGELHQMVQFTFALMRGLVLSDVIKVNSAQDKYKILELLRSMLRSVMEKREFTTRYRLAMQHGEASEAMSEDPEDLNFKRNQKPDTFLGRRMKEIRKARAKSLKQVSEASGLSVSHLSQSERGVTTPSIGALHRIAGALGARVSWFFSGKADSQHHPDEDGFVVRKKDRWEIKFNDEMRDEVLSPNLGRQIQMSLSRIEPGGYSGEAYSHEGEKCGLILTGKFELWVGERHFRLEEGDSFAFESREPHRYGNPGDIETTIVWTITPPRI
ncbi:cupin domain-containing protein [Mesorhizobium sp. M0522]|uniref:cupin domain-containing protein n=1 Tax=Mesorhizobium sp. M0522 TaxID=2956958 RepID=UPI00333A0B01